MNVPVVSHLKLLVNLYNKMNNRFLVLLVIYLIIYLLSVLYKNKQIFCAILLSLLSWERGLKFMASQSLISTVKSLLSWERGLKFFLSCHFLTALVVAPLVGAWIEIVNIFKSAMIYSSLLSWERGLKYRLIQRLSLVWRMSLLSWERGLKSPMSIQTLQSLSRSSRGSVD